MVTLKCNEKNLLYNILYVMNVIEILFLIKLHSRIIYKEYLNITYGNLFLVNYNR